jgi:gamma-glutamyltranspeptidase/glutathione hydrolase
VTAGAGITHRPRRALAFAALGSVLFWSAVLWSWTTALLAAEAGPGHAAVASAHPLATEAGLKVMRAGGNAFDAAVAISATLAVVEPTGSGLTGGGFYLLHRSSDGADMVIDARETAPGAASRDMFLDSSGNPVPRMSLQSAQASAVPGEVAGMAMMAAKYGRLPVAQDLAPAIAAARDGFALYPRLHDSLQRVAQRLSGTEPFARVFLRNGTAPPLGTRIRQPELAETLSYLAAHGLDAFYHGALAEQMVADLRAQGGIWSSADLAGYRALERTPVTGDYHGAHVVSIPPPSSGGIGLVEALNILANFDLHQGDRAQRLHYIIEASRRMHRDRAVYLGDPDFVSMPVARLTDPDYAAGLAASIRPDRATPSAALPGPDTTPAQGANTTHFSVIDRDGNRVAGTITLNGLFGSGRMLAHSGLLLNNEMDDFSVKPGQPNLYGLVGAEANAIAPGKRPLSSTTPAFIDAGNRLMIVGTPGGSQIIGMVLLATLDFVDGHSAAEIVTAPRIHHQYLPDVVHYESDALSPAERAELESRGHKLVPGEHWGNMQVIIWNRNNGTLEAAADPRGDGIGTVE